MAGTAEERFLSDLRAGAEHRNAVMGFLYELASGNVAGASDETRKTASMAIDLITKLEELIDDDERAMLPSVMRVCVSDKAAFLLNDTRDGKCPICNALLIDVTIDYDGQEDDDDDKG